MLEAIGTRLLLLSPHSGLAGFRLSLTGVRYALQLIPTSHPVLPFCRNVKRDSRTYPKSGYPVPGKVSPRHATLRIPELRNRRIEISTPDAQVKDPSLIDFRPKPVVTAAEEADAPDVLYSTIDIETKGHDRAVLRSYETFALEAAKHLHITVSQTKVGDPPYVLWRRTLLKSAHVHKSARVQYETRTYLRMLQIYHVTGSTADTFLEYLQRNLPEGVGMKVIRRQIMALPANIRRPLVAATSDDQPKTP